MFKKSVWKSLENELFQRHLLLRKLGAQLKKDGFDFHNTELAATDIFVEKAQVYLTWRARFLTFSGSLTAIMALLCFVVPSIILLTEPNTFPPIPNALNTNNTLSKEQYNYIFYLTVLRNSSIGGGFVAAAGLLIYICRSCFHEATILYNRRHALRFGRLFVYLRMSGDLFKLKELETAFKWTDEYSTAFKELKPESTPNTSIPGIGIFKDIVEKSLKKFTISKKKKNNKNAITTGKPDMTM
jgi:hypothetical protein